MDVTWLLSGRGGYGRIEVGRVGKKNTNRLDYTRSDTYINKLSATCDWPEWFVFSIRSISVPYLADKLCHVTLVYSTQQRRLNTVVNIFNHRSKIMETNECNVQNTYCSIRFLLLASERFNTVKGGDMS